MKELDLKSGDLIQWAGPGVPGRARGAMALVLSVYEPPQGTRTDCHKEAQALFDDGVARYIPDYQWKYAEVVSST